MRKKLKLTCHFCGSKKLRIQHEIFGDEFFEDGAPEFEGIAISCLKCYARGPLVKGPWRESHPETYEQAAAIAIEAWNTVQPVSGLVTGGENDETLTEAKPAKTHQGNRGRLVVCR